jgi:hypothetical protein
MLRIHATTKGDIIMTAYQKLNSLCRGLNACEYTPLDSESSLAVEASGLYHYSNTEFWAVCEVKGITYGMWFNLDTNYWEVKRVD